MGKSDPYLVRVLNEQQQGHSTRQRIIARLGSNLGFPVVTFYTSFKYPVMLEDADADMLMGVLQKMDLSKGLALFINSPGGDGLAAERMINVCRCHSGTKGFVAVVPGKAKSAATMVCFGAAKIIMGANSELGPIDPQLTVREDGRLKRFSVFNLIESYDDLFSRAVKNKGNLEPFLLQLAKYDEREIKEFRAALALSEDIAARSLASGMMKGESEADIKKKIDIFLTPKRTKTHGRPIYRSEAVTCGLAVETRDDPAFWDLVSELHVRTTNFVSTVAAKCFESKDHSFVIQAKPEGR
jgi:hypothetical protein